MVAALGVGSQQRRDLAEAVGSGDLSGSGAKPAADGDVGARVEREEVFDGVGVAHGAGELQRRGAELL